MAEGPTLCVFSSHFTRGTLGRKWDYHSISQMGKEMPSVPFMMLKCGRVAGILGENVWVLCCPAPAGGLPLLLRQLDLNACLDKASSSTEASSSAEAANAFDGST